VNLNGTTDWVEYKIKLPYNEYTASRLVLGALLVGTGKVWIDNLRLYIDGKPVGEVKSREHNLSKAQRDTAFQKNSLTDSVTVNKQSITNLAILCQVWGFLKYYNNNVIQGNFNMDAELFRVLPSVIKCKNNAQLSTVIEKWVDKVGPPELCINCYRDTEYNVAQEPDYGSIFDKTILNPSLVTKLTFIKNNIFSNNALSYNQNIEYYAEINSNGSGNVTFSNELPYSQMTYPDIGYRLLCLFRYWNMIQYFYPYKNLIGKNWNDALTEYIPKFILVSNSEDYDLTVLKLISSLHDTHANIWSNLPALEKFRGHWKLPFIANFIQNKLVITDFYFNDGKIQDLLKRGDIINEIGGKSVNKLINQYLPFTPGSNHSTQLRDMPSTYLLRTKDTEITVKILRDGINKTFNIKTLPLERAVDTSQMGTPKEYKVLERNIGYIYPGKYSNGDLPKIMKLFKNTRGIIVDMRCYPLDFMPFTFVPFVKLGDNPFAQASAPDVTYPGLFKFGRLIGSNGQNQYKNKVVVIVNEQTQSQAEYTTMAFQSSPNVRVLGSTTAGADGDVSAIVLPGGIRTMISGLGIFYPDGTATQRVGVKIDYIVKPTVEGVKTGRDELLDAAIKIINNAN